MLETNAYILDVKENKIKFLLEILIPNEDGITNYYYEIICNTTENEEKRQFLNVISAREVFDSIKYIHANFKGKDIRKYKVKDSTARYILEKLIEWISLLENNYNYNINNINNIIYNIGDSNVINNNKSEIESELLLRDISLLKSIKTVNSNPDKAYFDNKLMMKKVLGKKD